MLELLMLPLTCFSLLSMDSVVELEVELQSPGHEESMKGTKWFEVMCVVGFQLLEVQYRLVLLDRLRMDKMVDDCMVPKTDSLDLVTHSSSSSLVTNILSVVQMVLVRQFDFWSWK